MVLKGSRVGVFSVKSFFPKSRKKRDFPRKYDLDFVGTCGSEFLCMR